ncbi:MAG: type II toxin-antitoxin system PemK/MazF family toxin [Acidimicrobiaceae bacterium]|nr:type II toxin-antitoxin system PemK/MazF family toxin [Acidimicrobiaceae bacterium]
MCAHQKRRSECPHLCTCAPITRTTRRIDSEVPLGPEYGLKEPCVINCDNVLAIPIRRLDDERVGILDEIKRVQLDRALRYALDILY